MLRAAALARKKQVGKPVTFCSYLREHEEKDSEKENQNTKKINQSAQSEAAEIELRRFMNLDF